MHLPYVVSQTNPLSQSSSLAHGGCERKMGGAWMAIASPNVANPLWGAPTGEPPQLSEKGGCAWMTIAKPNPANPMWGAPAGKPPS